MLIPEGIMKVALPLSQVIGAATSSTLPALKTKKWLTYLTLRTSLKSSTELGLQKLRLLISTPIQPINRRDEDPA